MFWCAWWWWLSPFLFFFFLSFFFFWLTMVSFKQLGGLIYLILSAHVTLQQDDDSSSSCSFISGEGCLNGVCKFCAMCLPSVCILATPYSTGDNDGSTCAVTNQPHGYDFYNYCLSSGLTTNGDGSSDYDEDEDSGQGKKNISSSNSCLHTNTCIMRLRWL